MKKISYDFYHGESVPLLNQIWNGKFCHWNNIADGGVPFTVSIRSVSTTISDRILSFFDHCVLSLLQRFVQPFPVKNFAGSKTMLLRIYFARLGFSHSLALREQKPRADVFFPNWPWEILYKRLLFEDCSLSSSFSPWESPRSLKYFWYFLFSDGEIGQADCNMTIKVRGRP